MSRSTKKAPNCGTFLYKMQERTSSVVSVILRSFVSTNDATIISPHEATLCPTIVCKSSPPPLPSPPLPPARSSRSHTLFYNSSRNASFSTLVASHFELFVARSDVREYRIMYVKYWVRCVLDSSKTLRYLASKAHRSASLPCL